MTFSSCLDTDLTKEQLRSLAGSLLWQYRLVDAFWFINIENEHGLEQAERINAQVWAKVGELSARDIVKRFGITASGLEGFAQAMSYYPWAMMDSFDLEHREGEILITSAQCPAQLGRLKHGLGEYACKDMHHQEFAGFARVIDPRIRIRCDFAPPDPHPEDLFCKWRITLGADSGSPGS
jgi:hypothetical protein